MLRQIRMDLVDSFCTLPPPSVRRRGGEKRGVTLVSRRSKIDPRYVHVPACVIITDCFPPPGSNAEGGGVGRSRHFRFRSAARPRRRVHRPYEILLYPSSNIFLDSESSRCSKALSDRQQVLSVRNYKSDQFNSTRYIYFIQAKV